MLIINEDSVKFVRQKLDDPAKKQEVITDINNMLEIKRALQWRADAGTCCGSLCSIASFLTREIGVLEEVLAALGQGDDSRAIRLLKEYEHILETNHGPELPDHC